MIGESQHLSVCVCTYKRPRLLARLLEELQNQESNGLFSYSIVVVDNDASQSSQSCVLEFAAKASVPIQYCVERRQNIALARNKALENAAGEFIVFIDDDEFPTQRWLLNLFQTCEKYDVDGVLGPVVPEFETSPPKWITRGKFFERPNHQTGHKVPWEQTRTGNVLLRTRILASQDEWFKPELGTGGEDVDFFRRMTGRGCSFVWCSEAVVYEVVPESRCNVSYLLKRALLRGSNFPKRRTARLVNIAKSLVAVPAYTVILPVLAFCGRHIFIKYLIKFCDHSSRLLAFLGVNLVTQRQM